MGLISLLVVHYSWIRPIRPITITQVHQNGAFDKPLTDRLRNELMLIKYTTQLDNDLNLFWNIHYKNHRINTNLFLYLSDADKSKRRDSVISGNPEDGKSINKEDNQSLKDKEATEEPPSYLRIAPACALVFIFVGGSISIFVWEKRKERKKEQA